jgi:hypothetical protein
MGEISMDVLFWVVTVALFAYVLYAVVSEAPSSGCLSADLARAMDEKKKAETSRRRRRIPVEDSPAASSSAAPTPLPAVTPAEPAPAMEPESSGVVTSDSLRNPSTGETAAIPTNYRFAKRWIKEAMVAEGLLDKVYGTAELDAENGEKVRAALAEFKQLAKYKT